MVKRILGIKLMGLEVDTSPPFSADVKNCGSLPEPLPLPDGAERDSFALSCWSDTLKETRI
jgi:hypothetical protein